MIYIIWLKDVLSSCLLAQNLINEFFSNEANIIDDRERIERIKRV